MRKRTYYIVLAVTCDESWGGSLRPGIIPCELNIQDDSFEMAARRAVAKATYTEAKECHLSSHRVHVRDRRIEGATNYPKICCQHGLFEVALRRVEEYLPITLTAVAATSVNGDKYNRSIQIPYNPNEADMCLSVKQAVEQDVCLYFSASFHVIGVVYSNGNYAVSIKHAKLSDVFGTILFHIEDFEDEKD